MTKLQRETIKLLKKENDELRNIIKQIKHSIKCPYCLSITCIKRGKRYLKKRIVQRFECLSCGKRFTIRDESFRMKNNQEVIEKVIELSNKGYSSGDVAKKLGNISHKTICEWLKSE